MMTKPKSLDELLPMRALKTASTALSFIKTLNFLTGFSFQTVTDPTDGSLELQVSATPGGGAVYSGGTGMADANFAIVIASGEIYVGAGAAFTLDRTLTLPANPATPTKVRWKDETTGNILGVWRNAKNLIVSGNGKNIQYGTQAPAATYTATINPWMGGDEIEFFYNGTVWMVM